MTQDTEFIQAPQDALDLKSITLPDGIPERAKAVIVLRGFGLPISSIAKSMGGISESQVRYYLKKYDPTHISQQMSERRKMYLSSMFETVAIAAISTITAKDVETMTAKDKIQLAMTCARAIKEVGAKPIDPVPLSDGDLIGGLELGLGGENASDKGEDFNNDRRRGSSSTGLDSTGPGDQSECNGESDACTTDGASTDSTQTSE